MSSTGSPPFAFSRATATPQGKSMSTRESHGTGNVETASSSPSGGSPTSAVSPSSSVPSPQDVCGMPMPHAIQLLQVAASTAPSPASPTPAGLTATRPRQTFEGRRQLRQSIGSEVLHESDREDDRLPLSGRPSPDGSHSRHANAKILLACFPHHLLSRVPGHPYLAHATAARLLSRESAALSAPALVHGIPALAQAQAAVEVHDTTPMSQCPAHH